MRKTPQPWAVGSEGVVAPSVPFQESSHYNWMQHQRRRGYKSTYSPLEYEGELVCEGASFDDKVTIVHATRALPILIKTLEWVGEAIDLYAAQQIVQRTLIYVHSLREAIKAEGHASQERGRWVGGLIWEEPIAGMLPETATRARIEPPPPAWAPLRYVTDNIELAWLDRTETYLPF